MQPQPDREIVASARGLTKRYGATTAVRELDLDLYAGEVLGFLGPNGSGKTTTIKLLLGLVKPTAGEPRLFGEPLNGNLPRLLRRVGAMVEAPAFYPYLSGRDNLRTLARLDGLDDARIDSVLAEVDLLDAAGRKFDGYSVGMKQRLAIASTLLRDPRLIFLDEPTSGLDPAGQQEMRQLIPRLAGEGRTIFISSHLLHEAQQTCDRVVIMKQGVKLAEGPVETLLRDTAGTGSIDVRVADDERDRAVELLRALDWVTAVDATNRTLVVTAPAERSAELNAALARAEIFASELRPRAVSLEEFFLEVTGDGGARG